MTEEPIDSEWTFVFEPMRHEEPIVSWRAFSLVDGAAPGEADAAPSPGVSVGSLDEFTTVGLITTPLSMKQYRPICMGAP